MKRNVGRDQRDLSDSPNCVSQNCLSVSRDFHLFMHLMKWPPWIMGWGGIILYCTSNCIDFMLQLCFERELFFLGEKCLNNLALLFAAIAFSWNWWHSLVSHKWAVEIWVYKICPPPLLKHLELFQNILDSASTFGEITIIKVGAYLQRVSLENPTAKKTEEVIFREEVEEEVGWKWS